MQCQQCGHGNPESHKFCGMCGSKLEPLPKRVPIDDDDPLNLAEVRRDDAPIQARETEPVVAHIKARDRERELVRDSAGNRTTSATLTAPSGREDFPPDTVQEETEEAQQTEARDEYTSRGSDRGSGDYSASTARIGGPSLLGLGYDDSSRSGFTYDSPASPQSSDQGFIYDDASSPDYLLDEQPRRTVSWRAWALLAILLAAAALGYVQWRANHNQGQDVSQILAGNGATVPASGPVMAQSEAPAPSKKSDQAPAAQNDSPQSDRDAEDSDQQSAASNGNAEAHRAGTASTDKTNSEPKSNRSETGMAAQSSDAKDHSDSTAQVTGDDVPQDDKPAEKSKPDKPEPAQKTQSTQPTAPREKKAVAVEPAKSKSLGDKDPLIVQAEDYLQGRGVRQNCSTGVNLLRQAICAGNPAADVKMGALYWTGTCVTQSRVTAYEWFTRAHNLEPRNRWIERSRSSLWASMTPDEQHRVNY